MKRMSNKLMLLLAAMLLAVSAISCSKSNDEPEPGNGTPPEPISTPEIKYELNSKAMLVPEETCKNLLSVDTLTHRLT